MAAAAAAAEAAIQELLSSLGDAAAADIDTEVLAYLVSVVEDPDPESSLELISSVLAECVGAFAALDPERQTQLVLQLLDNVRPCWGSACCTPVCAWTETQNLACYCCCRPNQAVPRCAAAQHKARMTATACRQQLRQRFSRPNYGTMHVATSPTHGQQQQQAAGRAAATAGAAAGEGRT
jgi:hypothetical protein